MTEKKLTLGQAIDQITAALEQLDESTRVTAIQAACSHLGLVAPLAPAHTPATVTQQSTVPASPHGQSHSEGSGKKADIRSLKEEKQPNSARQMACVVAYYLQELAPADEKKETVSTKDIEKYFKQAGFKLPTKVEQVLVDAKRSGYFESAARGEYKLNAVGYNLVAHTLPSTKTI
ncbi:MAG: hypothetical protein ACYC9Z_16745 [Casimicrobiaceae bacterium]